MLNMEFLTVSVSIILKGIVSNSGKTVGQHQGEVDRKVYWAWGSHIHNIICQQTIVNEESSLCKMQASVPCVSIISIKDKHVMEQQFSCTAG